MPTMQGAGYITLQGGLRLLGFTSSAAAASLTELPNDKDFSVHKNTTSGVVSLCINDGGIIKSIAQV